MVHQDSVTTCTQTRGSQSLRKAMWLLTCISTIFASTASSSGEPPPENAPKLHVAVSQPGSTRSISYPEGGRFFSVAGDERVCIWDASARREVRCALGRVELANTSLSRNTLNVAITRNDGIDIWNPRTGSVDRRFGQGIQD